MQITFTIENNYGAYFKETGGNKVTPRNMYAKELVSGRDVLMITSTKHFHEQGGSYDCTYIKVYDKDTLEELNHDDKVYIIEV